MLQRRQKVAFRGCHSSLGHAIVKAFPHRNTKLRHRSVTPPGSEKWVLKKLHNAMARKKLKMMPSGST